MGAIFAKIYEKYKTFASNLVNRSEKKKIRTDVLRIN